jgi:hypothetical protein
LIWFAVEGRRSPFDGWGQPTQPWLIEDLDQGHYFND